MLNGPMRSQRQFREPTPSKARGIFFSYLKHSETSAQGYSEGTRLAMSPSIHSAQRRSPQVWGRAKAPISSIVTITVPIRILKRLRLSTATTTVVMKIMSRG